MTVCKPQGGQRGTAQVVGLDQGSFLPFDLRSGKAQQNNAALMSEPYQGRNVMMAARYGLSDTSHAIKVMDTGSLKERRCRWGC